MTAGIPSSSGVEVFADPTWQMSLGERAAVAGVLSQLAPELAIELGSAEGACLRHLARHAREVHSFDLTPPTLEVPDNAVLHTGDSHELLPALLEELVAQDRNVDFVLVDGDHSAPGVRRDLEDLLNSRALARTVILIHDIANPELRRGVDSVPFRAWPKVAHVELDWVPGQLFREPALRHELWYGLGLVVVDAARPAYLGGDPSQARYYPSAPLLAEARDALVAREAGGEPAGGAAAQAPRPVRPPPRFEELEAELAASRRVVASMSSSASWRLTAPLRAAKATVGRLRS